MYTGREELVMVRRGQKIIVVRIIKGTGDITHSNVSTVNAAVCYTVGY